MSAEAGRWPAARAGWKVSFAVALLVTAGAVCAGSLPDLLDDPLLARPPVLETGPRLPGDELPPPCPAEKDFKEPLNLAEAADLALCNNPQVRAAWAGIKIQAAALGEARAAYLPTVSATASRLRNRTAYPGTDLTGTSQVGNTAYGSLSWRLADFGGRAANREAAERLLEAALANHEAGLQKTLAAVVQGYFDALAARGAHGARREEAALARGTLEAVARKEAKGAAPHSDALQAATALARAELAERRTEGEERKALAVLVQALGVPVRTAVRLPEDGETAPPLAGKALDDWLAEAEARHPAIRAARAQWQAAQRKVAAARSEGLPTVDFSANVYQNGYPGQGLQATQSRMDTLGVTLAVPLFEGFSRTYKIRGAQAQAEEKAAQLADTEQQVLAEVVKAWADALSSLGNLQSSEALLKAAAEALASSRRRYDKGAADILELLSVQTSLAEARMERLRGLSEWRAARLRLLAAAGVFGRGMIGGDGRPR